MLKLRRGLAAAALLAVSMTGAPAPAQQSNTVGPAELRDFRLPGERTTPPAPAPALPAPQPERPAATTPPPAERTPAPARTTPAPPAATTPRPAERTPAPAAATPPTPAQPAAPADVTAEPVPGPQLPVTLEPPVANEQQPVPAPAPAASAPAAEQGGLSWAWLAVPVGLALLAFAFLRSRRRETPDEAAQQAEVDVPAPRPEPAAATAAGASARRLAEMPAQGTRTTSKPALKLPPKVRAVPPAPPAPPQPVGPRAHIEVEFIPARASATLEAATVEFELVLKNVGDAAARNIRIDTRMFNASATKEMAEFLKGPIHDLSGSPHVLIEPGDELRLQSAMAMPVQDVREILMQGQRLFVPAVASVVAWDWSDDGRGRVSLSWLVGRETEDRAAKMGAFRLDLGPRIYRQVGVRPLKLVA